MSFNLLKPKWTVSLPQLQLGHYQTRRGRHLFALGRRTFHGNQYVRIPSSGSGTTRWMMKHRGLKIHVRQWTISPTAKLSRWRGKK